MSDLTTVSSSLIATPASRRGFMRRGGALSAVAVALGNRDLAQVAARLAADETMHFTLLNNALGRPLPAGALSFGA